VKYPAPGAPDLARRVKKLLAPLSVELGELGTRPRHLVRPPPRLSTGGCASGSASHRRKSALVFPLRGRQAYCSPKGGRGGEGSGNLVHNLHVCLGEAHGAAVRLGRALERNAKALLLAADDCPLVNYESLGRDALLSIPTRDHYLPLLYVLGTRIGGERLSFPVEGVDGGSISMLAVQIG
jgi:4,5-DOPA dioxygenase extradiol